MSRPQKPDKALLQSWLDDAGMAYYECDQCEGLHLRALQDTQAVIDSRLFMESYGLLLTTELEGRPAALLQVSADVGRLNMDYPTLKIFLDVADDIVPQLVVASHLHAGAGITPAQFRQFVSLYMEAAGHLAGGCLHMDYLFTEAAADRTLLH